MKKITFRFNRTELVRLHELLREELTRPLESTDWNKRLYLCELHGVDRRIYSRFYFNQESYTVSFNLAEALAFFCYFNPMEFTNGVQVKTMCAEIHKQLI